MMPPKYSEKDTAEDLIPQPYRNRLDEIDLDGGSVVAHAPGRKLRRLTGAATDGVIHFRA
jgi:hypothetical protein